MSYKIRLEIFEGPLDLLLYLIKKEELDIYNIPITRITEQYLEYLNLMELMDLDIAGDFLVMAATLMQIKSRMLLPPDPEGIETEELDPRAELVRRLLEYKAFKEAAERLRNFEADRSGIFTRFGVEPEKDAADSPFFEVSLFELLSAFSRVLKTIPKETFHQVVKEEYSVGDKITELTERLKSEPKIYFSRLFQTAKHKGEVIVIFLALLELIKQKQVSIIQEGHFGEIEITKKADAPALAPEITDTPEIQSSSN